MKRLVMLGDRQVTLEWKPETERFTATVVDQEQTRTREVSFVEVEPGVYSLLLGAASYEVRVARNSRKWIVQSRGASWHAEVVDPRAASARRGGLGKEGRQTLAAPMPGKVVRVLVEEGAQVEEGQGLVVVEAMKMQNEMKAPKAGKVIALAARAGASVAAGDELVTLE